MCISPWDSNSIKAYVGKVRKAPCESHGGLAGLLGEERKAPSFGEQRL